LFTLTAAGALTFNAAPNFEAPADAGANNVYDVTVTPTDGTNAGVAAAVAITVSNVDDNATTAVADTNVAVNTVAENSAAGAVVGVTALATDADTGATVSYTLDAATLAAGQFAINATTGVVTTTGTSIDYETTASINVGVVATSSDGSTPTTATFAVAVTGVNTANSLVLTAESGALTVNGVVTADGDGNVTLNADGGQVALNAAVSSTSGNISITKACTKIFI